MRSVCKIDGQSVVIVESYRVDAYTIDTHSDYIVDGRAEVLDYTMQEVQDWDIETWKWELKETLKEDAVYFDDSVAAEASTTCEDAVNEFLEKYLGYELSRAFAQAYVTDAQKQLMMGYADSRATSSVCRNSVSMRHTPISLRASGLQNLLRIIRVAERR